MTIYHVYNKYHSEFIRFAKHTANNHQNAFDIVQEAYVKALENEAAFSYMNEYQIKGWFFTVIKNKYIDYLRKENRVLHTFDEDNYSFQRDLDTPIYVNQLIERLPIHLQEVIRLKYMKGLNSKEIGEIIDISSSAVRTRLSTAIKILKSFHKED